MKYSFVFVLFIICNVCTNAQGTKNDQGDDIYCHKMHSFMPIQHSVVDDERIDMHHYDIDWFIDPNIYAIKGIVKPSFTIAKDNVSEIEFDLTTKLKVNSITHNGLPLAYRQENGFDLVITLARTYNVGEKLTISIDYSGAPNSGGLGSFSKGTHAGVPAIWNVSPPFGSQDWWPCKNGLTDKIDSLDIRISCPEKYKAATNGILVNESIKDGIYSCHWKHNYPIVSYLVGVAVTNFDRYTDTLTLKSGKQLPVVNYVYPESVASSKSGTKELLKTLAFYDSLFIDYPYSNEKYGHAQFGFGGGMEHQTMSFVTNFSFGLLAHELAHQWFGDLVTCGDWEDTWLNEGSATYLEGLAQERFKGASFTTWKINKRNNVMSSPSGSVKVPPTTSAGRIFDGRLTYDKGAYVQHMLRWVIGDQPFFNGMRTFLQERQYGFATTPDFVRHMETSSGRDLDEFFRDWYEGQGFPEYAILWQQIGSKLYIKVDQKQSNSSVSYYEMPLPVRLTDKDGDKFSLRLDNNSNGQIFEIDVQNEITKLDFDPTFWLLSKSTVKKEIFSSIEDGLDNKGVTILPNPANDYIEVANGINKGFVIYDAQGRKISYGIIEGKSLNIALLSDGIYTICIDNQTCLNFVKQ